MRAVSVTRRAIRSALALLAWRGRGEGRSRHLAFVLALAILLVACGADETTGDDDRETAPAARERGQPEPNPQPRGAGRLRGELVASFLDVGQGDATLLQTKEATVLVDAGRHDRSDVVPALRALDVERIDVIAISHAHADHIGQLADVIGAFEVGEVWMSGTPHTTRTFERALAAIEDAGVGYEEPRAGDTTRVGRFRVEVVHPARLAGDLHADSLSMRVSFGGVAFLFTGDAEIPHESEMLARDPGRLDAEIYQVGHHGSRTSTGSSFLQAVSPEVAVYSAAADNPYGHPHREVISRLRGAGIEIYGTDVHGTVTVASDGRRYEVATERSGRPRAGGRRSRDSGPGASSSGSPSPARSEAERGEGCVDLNRAGARELERITHVGAERAAQIISMRPFTSVDELTRVNGIAEARLADIKAQGIVC